VSGRHFLHVFATFDPGGPQVRAANLMDLLPAPDRHTVVAMDGRTGCRGRVRRAAVSLAAPPAASNFVAAAREMALRVRALAPDLVLTYNWGAIETVLACRLARHRRLVHHEEGFGPEEADRQLVRRVVARRLLLPAARAVVVPSRTLERLALERWRLGRRRVRYLPNGVDLGRFPAGPAPGRQEVVVGSVAHFRPEKDQALLVRAFARSGAAATCRLQLVGDGGERAAVAALAGELGVGGQIDFLGAVADTAPVYRQFDVFALSSRTEQMPLVVLEAMAAGLPIAATAVGDVKDMVADENRAFIVPRDDAAALARAIDALCADAELRRSIGAANRARCADHFELGARLRAHLALYEEVLAEPAMGLRRRGSHR
jgi:glycosyltransferase involved in cell wall biosynthesis